MKICKVTLHRFKKFRDATIEIKPGVSLLAGGNSSGKTSLLQGLAIWEFCRTVLETERGKASLCTGPTRQGVGLSDDEFTPVNVPSLKHLWTNLKSQKENENDGYTLWVQVDWVNGGNEFNLKIGLSLVNDRLFIKTLHTNVQETELIPHVAYIPPFAGISPREPRFTPAIIRKYIGQGLPGAVIRNVLLDLYLENERKRKQERESRGGAKLRQSFLRKLRREDPYEILQDFLRKVFSYGIKVKEFSDVYHTYINIETFRGEFRNNRFQRFLNYNPRDLMVEGSGFLQWLTVLSLTLDPKITLVLLDEPDAHLHPSLQQELLIELNSLSNQLTKQILYATHSSELIKHHQHDMILNANGNNPKYLGKREQKVSLLAGLGSEYTPRLADLETKRRILYVENLSDADLLKIMAKKMELPLPDTFVVWPWASGHKERKYLHAEMRRLLPNIVGISLVDRDLQAPNSVRLNLTDKAYPDDDGQHFFARKWRRRHIEGYLLHPDSIARAIEIDPADVIAHISQFFALDLTGRIVDQSEPEALLQANAKDIMSGNENSIKHHFNKTKYDIANSMTTDEIPQDIRSLILEIRSILGNE